MSVLSVKMINFLKIIIDKNLYYNFKYSFRLLMFE